MTLSDIEYREQLLKLSFGDIKSIGDGLYEATSDNKNTVIVNLDGTVVYSGSVSGTTRIGALLMDLDVPLKANREIREYMTITSLASSRSIKVKRKRISYYDIYIIECTSGSLLIVYEDSNITIYNHRLDVLYNTWVAKGSQIDFPGSPLIDKYNYSNYHTNKSLYRSNNKVHFQISVIERIEFSSRDTTIKTFKKRFTYNELTCRLETIDAIPLTNGRSSSNLIGCGVARSDGDTDDRIQVIATEYVAGLRDYFFNEQVELKLSCNYKYKVYIDGVCLNTKSYNAVVPAAMTNKMFTDVNIRFNWLNSKYFVACELANVSENDDKPLGLTGVSNEINFSKRYIILDNQGNEIMNSEKFKAIRYVGLEYFIVVDEQNVLKIVDAKGNRVIDTVLEYVSMNHLEDFLYHYFYAHSTLPILIYSKGDSTKLFDYSGVVFDIKDIYSHLECSYCLEEKGILRVNINKSKERPIYKYVDNRLTPITNFNYIKRLDLNDWIEIK